MKVYQRIAELAQAIENCIRMKNEEWQDIHESKLEKIMDSAPSGSGFDSGTKLATATDKHIIFDTAYHHLNENGYYEGWTHHEVRITPAFIGFKIYITGKNKNDIKDYIADTFHDWLNSEESTIDKMPL